MTITDTTKIPLGKAVTVAVFIGSIIWWAAGLTKDVSVMKEDIATIKGVIAPEHPSLVLQTTVSR